MRKNIVFDMGNVLLDFRPEVSLRRYCATEEEQMLVRAALFDAPVWLMADAGMISDRERYEVAKRNLPKKHWPALKNCCDHWEICMEPIPGAWEFVRDCKERGYRIYILSNASDLFFTYFKNFSPLDYFDGAVISFQEKLLKPEAEIYRRLLRRYGLKPEECLFIDDREENIRAARAEGMEGWVFRNDYSALRRLVFAE